MKKAMDKTGFEEQYLSLRQKEGRLYTDEEVAQLPSIRRTHPLYTEWKIRRVSSARLVRYLRRQNKPLHIVEIGCGNGWLCHQLSGIPNSRVTGIDINSKEVEQARRVFPLLQFVYGNPKELEAKPVYDTVVFAASFQYFPSPGEILPVCFSLLKAGGEVHILDTYFYSEAEAGEARKRSEAYFAEHGFAGLQPFYFHHTWASLKPYRYDVLYQPRPLFGLLRTPSPFPWIRIKS